ncbi:BnaCnng66750D [Brassica napus]|uniref:BnaCnng66750D protein n=1 Tax=Brassica napus TaxID=3708 RepID=A0A078JUI1_BRANA|nr:BnaCnng66750D [Brassica napus]
MPFQCFVLLCREKNRCVLLSYLFQTFSLLKSMFMSIHAIQHTGMPTTDKHLQSCWAVVQSHRDKPWFVNLSTSGCCWKVQVCICGFWSIDKGILIDEESYCSRCG